ncbi:glycogen synthase [Pseudomonadota bacterium]
MSMSRALRFSGRFSWTCATWFSSVNTIRLLIFIFTRFQTTIGIKITSFTRGNPLSPDTRLNICLVCSELNPLAKTGGLADVTAALAHYFHSRGHPTLVLTPFYASLDVSGFAIEPLPVLEQLDLTLGDRRFEYRIVKAKPTDSGPDIHLLDCPDLYHGTELYSGPDEHLRFILLSRVAIEMCQRLKFTPDIFHCHDWHTALVPAYLKTIYNWDLMFKDSKTVLTLHNMAYQGVFDSGILDQTGLADSAEMLDQEDLAGGRINFLKTGVMHADLLTTVSPSYSREILEPENGMGLDGHLRARGVSVTGILNGVDYTEWNPQSDPLIPFPYSAKDLSGKEKNKQALMKETGLEYQFDKPLVGMATRLTYQKGIDLVQQVLPGVISSREMSLVVVGNGDSEYEEFFRWMQAEYPGRVSFFAGFNNQLTHRIEAGSDMFLMPSRYEPCGLNQMYSLKYGTVPVVRATGGLIDSVQPFDHVKGTGTGVVFHDYDANGLKWALNTALDLYENKFAWKQVVFNGMAKDYSWEKQGKIYLERFRRLLKLSRNG